MNTVFTDAICRILCLRRRRTYHRPAIAITHCASVFRIVEGGGGGGTTVRISRPHHHHNPRFSPLFANTSVLLSSFLPCYFSFLSFFFFEFPSQRTPLSPHFVSALSFRTLERFSFQFLDILFFTTSSKDVTLMSVQEHFLESLHSRAYTYIFVLYSNGKSHQFSRPQRFNFFLEKGTEQTQSWRVQ